MTPKKKTTSIHDDSLAPNPTSGKEDPTKHSPPLDVRYTVSNPSDQDPTTVRVAVPSNTPIPDANNTPV